MGKVEALRVQRSRKPLKKIQPKPHGVIGVRKWLTIFKPLLVAKKSCNHELDQKVSETRMENEVL